VLGETYVFTVDAINSVGNSVKSTAFTLKLALVPDAPSAPTTGIINSDEIQVSWIAPSENGATIKGYDVYFKKQDETYNTVPYATTETTFTLSATTLRNSPYSLTDG
jgi:hypothetical protein